MKKRKKVSQNYGARKKRSKCLKKRKRNKEKYAKKLRERMTPAENHLWGVLKKEQSGTSADFQPQQVVAGYIPDFVEEDTKLIVEVDGPIHKYLRKRDEIRTQRLNLHGYKVIRFTNNEVFDNVHCVVKRIFVAYYDLLAVTDC